MADISAKIKGLNVEFNDNLATSPNIDSGDDIKTSFARIHKRFSQMKSAAYIDASISDNKTITLGASSIGVVSISQNQGLTDTEKTNARTNIGAGTSNFNGSFNSLTDKPTTLSGYGITDANINNGTITLGSNTITPVTSFSSLDSPAVGGSGKYISSISETDGIISATETTLDTVPTANSTNAITSGAVYTDSTNQQLEIDYAINTGAKNLINYDGLGYTSRDGVTRTTRGVTFTLNSDGTVSCSGTNDGTGVSRCRLFLGSSLLYIQDYCTGGYMISGCPANGSSSTYYLSAYANTSPSYSVKELGSGAILTEQSVSGNAVVEMVIESEVDSTGVVFKPMIRYKYIKSTTFELYAKTNRELTVAENENRAALIGQVNGGAKNMIDAADFTSQTKNGITLTKNADDSFTITGTFTSRVTSFFTIDSIVGVESTVLAFEGGEAGIYAYARNGNPASWLTSSGGVPVTTGVPIPNQNIGASFDIAIMVNNTDGRFDNYVFNKTVRTMICTDADYTISPAFEPYAPTNRELYETKLDIESGRTTDISTTVKAGIYRYYGTGATTGLPSDITNTAPFGMLQVLTDDSYITQLLYSYVSAALAPAPDLYIRRSADSGRTWTPWLKVLGTSNTNTAFGTCDSTADAQIKAVTMTDPNWTRTVGGIIAVKFSNTNTFSATASDKIKLSVNGEEAEIYYNTVASPTGTNTACYGYANRYVYYIWEGTYWVWYSHGAENNTTYSSMSEAEIRAGTSTTARLITPARLNLAIRGLGTSLSSGADLNTLLTSGAYYTSTAAIAKSCTHRPAYSNDSNTLFRLEVLYIASTSILMQKLYTIQTSGTEIRQIHEYYRGYQSSTWGSWRQVTDTTIADYTG